MLPEFEDFWNSDEHRNFVDSLGGQHLRALRDLLFLAALADDMVSFQERADLAAALEGLPGLEELMEFDTAATVDHIDDLYAAHEERGDILLEELLEDLGDENDRKHAFKVAVVLMATNELDDDEESFARHLADLIDLNPVFVDTTIEEFKARARRA